MFYRHTKLTDVSNVHNGSSFSMQNWWHSFDLFVCLFSGFKDSTTDLKKKKKSNLLCRENKSRKDNGEINARKWTDVDILIYFGLLRGSIRTNASHSRTMNENIILILFFSFKTEPVISVKDIGWYFGKLDELSNDMKRQWPKSRQVPPPLPADGINTLVFFSSLIWFSFASRYGDETKAFFFFFFSFSFLSGGDGRRDGVGKGRRRMCHS